MEWLNNRPPCEKFLVVSLIFLITIMIIIQGAYKYANWNLTKEFNEGKIMKCYNDKYNNNNMIFVSKKLGYTANSQYFYDENYSFDIAGDCQVKAIQDINSLI